MRRSCSSICARSCWISDSRRLMRAPSSAIAGTGEAPRAISENHATERLAALMVASDRMPRRRLRSISFRHEFRASLRHRRLASLLIVRPAPPSRRGRTNPRRRADRRILRQAPALPDGRAAHGGHRAQPRARGIRARPLPRIRPRRSELSRVPGAAELSEVRGARDHGRPSSRRSTCAKIPTRPTRTRSSTTTRRRSPSTAMRRPEKSARKSFTRTAAARRISSGSTAWASTSRARSC